jgi:hypothetical protein
LEFKSFSVTVATLAWDNKYIAEVVCVLISVPFKFAEKEERLGKHKMHLPGTLIFIPDILN